ncbi:Hypothetical protein A7982_10001 [Minicystis rosea]|nr:Hypothetical protein A7982_10001 [Minicystis rosea]
MEARCTPRELLDELRDLIHQPMDVLDGVVLLEILYYATVRLPSGKVFNATDAEELLGREDCAAIVASLMGTIDPLHLKIASLSDIDRRAKSERMDAWLAKLKDVGITVGYA